MVEDMALIEVENASFDYGQGNVFQGLNFTVEKGEIFCLLGPNGCGKTTLLDCILGVRKVKTGRIMVEGMEISNLSPSKLARVISYVPQRHESTFPYRVLEMALMGRAAYTGFLSIPGETDYEIAEEALRLTGIVHLKDRPYTRLSGGELQLVLIARALAQKSPVIIMDEPTSHLDFKHELVVLENIITLVRDRGISIVMATHIPNHAFYFEENHVLTRVAMLMDKGFLAVGRPQEILSVENIRRLYGIDSTLFSFSLENQKEQRRIIPIQTVK